MSGVDQLYHSFLTIVPAYAQIDKIGYDHSPSLGLFSAILPAC